MTAKIIDLYGSNFTPAALDLARLKKSEKTLETYQACVARFECWLNSGHGNLQTSSLGNYLAVMNSEGFALSTIVQAYSAIIDRWPDLKSDQVSDILAGIRRVHASCIPEASSALLLDDAQKILDSLGDSLRDCRDKAFLSVCWATASRKSELLSLDVSSIVHDFGQLWIVVREKKKTTSRQKLIPGAVGDLTIPLAPTTHLMDWIRRSGIESGPLFRGISRWGKLSEKRLSRSGADYILNELVKNAGFNPDSFSMHSMRSGFVTWAFLQGYSIAQIQAVTGHKCLESLRHYMDKAIMAENHPLKGAQI